MVNYTGKLVGDKRETSDFVSKTVEDFMQEYYVSFAPDTDVREAARTFAKYDGLMGGPVVDGSGQLIGYLSEHNCLRHLADALINNQAAPLIKDVMHKDIEKLSKETPILTALDQFLKNWYYAYPVVDAHNKAVGILPRKTVLRHLATEKPTNW